MTKANINIEMLKRAVLEKKLKEQLKKRGDHASHLSIRKADRHLPLPLSFAQQRLWFLSQFDPAASQAYHMPMVLQLSGQLDVQALMTALNHLIARQESLRTHFTLVDGQPCQQIAPADTGFALPCRDLRALSETARANRVAELTEYEVFAPFDLTQGPLVRGQLLQLTDEEHMLLFTQHHIISDGWSVGILVRELAALYQAARAGQAAALPPLPVQYADYAVWQRDALQGDRLTALRDFWHTQLQGAPALLELPTDRPRPSVQSYAGSRVSFHLSAAVLKALKAVGQSQGTTLFMTLLAAWAVVLARLSGQDDIVIGTPVANRTRRELEDLMGFFANTLALRIEPGQCRTVAELLAQVRERTLAAYAHQDLPFEQVVEALQPVRSLSYSPIFQVMLVLNNMPAQTLALPGLALSLVEQPQRSSQFDLTLSLTETDAGLAGRLEYASDLFDQATVVRIAGYLEKVLTAMATDVTQTVPSLPMLSADERQQLLVDFNAPQTDFPQEALIHELFEQQAMLAPDAIAVVCAGQSLSYGELNRRANRLAHHLLTLGVQPDDRVAICVERSPEMVVGLLGILKAGAAYLPLDPAYPAERLAYMLSDAAPVALLTQSVLAETLDSHLPTVVLDARSPSALDGAPDSNPDSRARGITSRHLAYVIYTSGSTGQPKGVMVEHANILRLLAATQDYFRFSHHDVWTLFHSFAFDFSVWELWGALAYGGRLVIVPAACARSPQAFYALLCDERVTVLNQTPSAFRQLIPAQDDTAHALRCIIFGGEALELPLLAPWIANNPISQTRLVNMYGITEITVHATYRELTGDDISGGRGSLVGQPLPDLHAYLLDPHGQPVPLGVTGELYIGGVGVARGYLNRPALTAERFIPDPFSTTPGSRLYKTGDLGRWLPDGNIEYLGRNDFQVKLRGFRIELGEIEARLAQCSGVRDAVVIAREDIPGDTRLVAYLLPQPGTELVPAALRQQLAQHLADYMLPSAFVMLEAFPLTPNGKLDRKALPAPEQSAVAVRGYEAPIGEVETTLTQIWQDLLGLERIGRHDHFFELGGHSLLVVSVIERLRQQGWEQDVRTVFTTPVLADLARVIQASPGNAPAFIVPPNQIPDGSTVLTPEMLPLVTLSQAEIDTIVNRTSGGVTNVQDIYPLAPLQEGILFHYLLNPAKDPYVISSLLCVDRQADLDAFTAALQAVIDRHDILRTAVHWAGLSQPVQVVHRHTPLPVHRLSLKDGDDVAATLQARMGLSYGHMDLSRAPLIRLQTAADPHSAKLYVLLQFHHIIDDNLSLRQVLAETAAYLLGKSADLPPSVPYRNFVAYARQESHIQAAETFFPDYLADLDEVTAPFGLINVQEESEHTAEARQSLNAGLSCALRETARKLGTSPAALFHAGWALVVARTSGRDDIVFGTTLSGRMSGMAGSAGALGMFINTLPVRLKLKGISAEALVKAVTDTCASLLHYEQTPLSLVQRYSGFGNMPLFSALLNCRHVNDKDSSTLNLSQFGITSLAGRERTNYPVGISIDDDGRDFMLSAQTVSTVDPNRINAYLVRALEQLVAILADAPHSPALSVDVVPAAERQQLLVDFNATDRDFPQAALIHELVEQQAARTPDATAVLFEGQSLSYGELNRRANQLAHHLIALGVQPDDRVAICTERSPAMVVGLLGAIKAGGAYVPLDPTYPTERLAYMLADAAPVVLLTQTSLAERLDSSLPTVLLDTPACDSCADNNPDTQARGLTPQHLAYVIYTSGSTGQPKGVMVEHSGLRNLINSQIEAFRITADSRLLQFASFSFDACISEIATTLCQGACLVLASREALLPGEALLNTLQTQAITHVTLPPVAASALAPDADLPDLMTLVLAGEACPPALVKRWASGRRMINAYGPTECTVCATLYLCDARDEKAPPIGQPIANTRIYILDAQGQPVPLGVAGEIHIGGAGVTRGYLNRPALTAERFIPDPFSSVSGARLYKTGDLGRWLPDGNIEYLGRNDFQVKLRGFRIEPGEIEVRLTRCAGVQEAVVIAREDRPGDKRLVAYLRPQPGVELVPAELRQQLAQHLADYMLPGAFVMLETFPLTPNGKLDRKALPDPEQSAVATRGYEDPEGELETLLAQIWQELLGLERVGRHDHFFELGGHSLMAVSLIERLRGAGWLLDVRSIFSTPILSEMALAIQAHQGKPAFVVPPNPITGDSTILTPDLLPMVKLSQTELDTIVSTVPGGVANVQDIYPLAPLQEGILFHHRLQEQGDTYLLNSLVAFDSRTRLDAFLDALQQVIDRHDILRTAICWQGLTQPVQVVWRQAPLSVNTFVPVSAENVLAQLQTHTNPRQRRHDLSQAPLFTADIAYDPTSHEWLLALGFHHLIGDHMTLELIIAEIRLLLQGRAGELSDSLPYRNFIAQTLSVPASVHEDYFRTQLADVDEPTAPFGLLNVQGDGEDVSEINIPLDTTQARAIRNQARRLGISPSVLFHVAWAQVLAQTSGRDDVVFGTVLLGRLQGSAGADRVMGLFINTLPLRVSLAGRSAREVVQATYHNLTTLLEHEQAPLALAQRCSGVMPPMPLFSALLNYRHSQPDADDTTWDGMRLLVTEERTNYPLTLSVDDFGEGFNLVAQAISGIDPTRVANYLVTAISGLTEALATESRQSILSLPVLPAAERQQILVDFNATQVDFPQEALIHELFEQQAERTPDTIAVVFEEHSLSYKELNHRANCLAHHLIALGVKPDDRIAICAERSPEMVVGLLGILKAGAAYLPLDPAYPAERLAYMLSDAAPVALLTQTALLEALNSPLPTVVLDDGSASGWDNGPAANPDTRALGLASHHLACVIYTSGSTGQPKGVMNSHRALCNRLVWMQAAYGLTPADRVLQKTPFSFDVSVWEFFWPLLWGARLVMARPEGHKDTGYLARLIETAGITTLHFVPSMLQQFVQRVSPEHTCASLKRVICSGEALPHELQQRFFARFEAELHNLYGPTEAAIDVTHWTCQRGDKRHFVPIGRPIANTQLYILDALGQPVPLGVAGEIHIGGVGVARGYLNRPALTAERFIPDPFSPAPEARLYKTGDLGRWLPDGSIDYLGRNDFQVKLRGFRIELGEIEVHLTRCAGVQEAVVIAREDSPGDKRLVAYLRPQPGTELVPAALRQQLVPHLADYMLPSAFVMLETFPLTLNGKLDRRALPAPDQSAVATRAYEAPEGTLETTLAQIWQNLLGRTRISRHDHFFELGGHSLMAVSLIEQLRNAGWRLDVRSIFSAPVLTDMAQAVRANQGEAAFIVPPNRIPDGSTALTPEMLPLVTLSQAEIDTIVETVAGGAANVQDIYPLAPLQAGILFHHRLQEQGDAYLLHHLIAFDTRARLDDFTAALQAVINRHDILRTAVCWQGLTQPVQVVWRQAPLSVTTFVPASPDNVPAQLQAHTDPRQRQIDLSRAPLFAADIAHDPTSNEWLLALSLHHVVCDHMTLGLIIAEIIQLLQGQTETLPIPLPYRNFIAQILSVPASVHEDYFRARLADVDAPTTPFGLLDIQGDGEDVTEARFLLDTSLSQAIRMQARRLGINPGVLFHVAWAQMLAQTSGCDDVVFGTVLLGRLQGSAGADQVMGMFINTLPVRVSLANRSVREVVHATYHDLMALLEHEQAPLTLAQGCSGVKPPMPLFSALLNYRHSQPGTDNKVWDGMRILNEKIRTNYPLTLSVDDLGEDFSLLAQAVAGVEPLRLINYLITAISGLVEALATEPEQSILSLPILPAAERQQLLVDFNATQADFPQTALIHELFEQQVKRTPDAIAVAFESQSLSYAELNHRANRLAHHLLALGVQPDERVALCVDRSPEMVVGLLAILKSGGTYVPLDPAYPAERLAYMLADATLVALLTQSALIGVLGSNLPTVILDAQELPVFDKESEENPNAQALGLTSRHLAYVIYTSGSTGQPKGVMVEHRSLCNLVDAQIKTLNITADSRLLQFASFSFDVCIQECFMALLTGARLQLAQRAKLLPGPELFHTLKENAITHMLLTPTALAALETIPATLQTLVVGGEICSPTLIKRWATGRRMINAYGPTESTVCTTFYLCNPQDGKVPPIGQPIANTQIYILDTQGQPVPLGVAGEIHIGGVGVARGYLNRPTLTAERFIPDPFSTEPGARLYKTGDIGRWLSDGNIEYLGRNDFQVKLRGFRIELGEIEAHLARCAGVQEAVVIAREDLPGDKRLVAYVRPQPGTELVPAELRQQLAQHLAEYMLPGAFVTLESFPFTPNGKLDRKALPAPDQSAVVARDYEAPISEPEILLAQIWQELLGLEHVGRHDHFFELGGNSLMAVNLIERLRGLGQALDVRSVFSAPVLTDMAQAIQAHQGKPAFVVPPNPITGDSTVLTPDLLPLVTLSQTEIDSIVETVAGGAVNVQDIYPLAPLQEGILFHHRMQEQGDTYLLNNLVAFDSRTRLDAFLGALQQVIDRHDILRTAICWQGLNQPVQVVWRQASLPVNTFVPTSEGDVLAQLQAHTNPRLRRLDLSQAPLFAADIAHDPTSHEWLLALSFHHLVGDHMTLALIVDEIRLLLEDRTEELSHPLPYRNFIAQTLSVPDSVHEDYFRVQLADIDAPTAPFGLLNRQNDEEDIAEARLPLDITLARAIRSQSRRLGISPSVLFHVAWAQVLAQTSGRDDVVFGSVLLGRLQGYAGADQVMGMFINTLPLRVSLAGHSVLEVVQATYRNLTALLEHEQAPLTLAQRCSGVMPPMPLFSALLNYRHSQPDADDTIWDGMHLLATEERTNYPLTLSVDDLGEGFNLVAQAVSGIDPSRVANYLVTAISGLTEALATESRQSILSLPVLPAAERQQILVDFNATRADFPQATLIHELFEQQAARTPDAIAVVFKECTLSYGELNRRANRLAHHLIALGVQPDDRVAICVERSLEMMVGLLGILKAGAAYVPLDPAYPSERLAYILNDAGPVALLTQSALIETLGSSLPAVLLDISVFGAYAESNPDTHTLGLTSRHLAYVIYTSGSTGHPKGVMVEHRNIIASTYARQLTYPHFERLLLLSSIAFDSSLASIFGTLTRGGSLYLPEQEITVNPTAILQALHQNAISCLLCVPSLALSLLQLANKEDMASLRALIVAGERCLPELHTRIEQLGLPIALYNEYGPTEATVWASVYQVMSHDLFNVPIGRPIANTQIYILDAQDQAVPIGVAGEIHIGGVGVTRGYLDRPALTAERFIPDPFSTEPDARLYKTGDIGRWLPDGNIEYLGRNDFQVKLRGFRIELGEIETRLAQCPGVREAVVIAREDIPGEKRLVAYLQPQSGVELVPAELRQQLAQQLAEYMIPSAFVMLETFPLTPNGKLDRQALPAPDQSAVATRVYAAPEGTLETALALIWQDLLGLESVSRHDHFFELGGHSLMAVSLIERLRNAGWLLDVRNVFSTPVLTEMAQMIQAHQGKPAFVVPPNRITEDCTTLTPDLLPLVTLSQAEIDTIVGTVPGGTANVQDIYPLAPLQEGILFHHRLQEQGDAYLLCSLVAFDTRERLDAFLSALQRVINRHDILRTAICWQGLTQPVQVVWRQASLPVNTFVPTSKDNVLEGNVLAQLQAYTDPHQRRLNLNQAPLFSADIAHDPANHEWLLALSFHHMISDHMTLELIVSEINLLLQERAELLPVPLPYRNFIAQTLNVPASVHEDYFRARLADIDAPTAPFGLLNVQGDGKDVAETYLKLDTTLARAIRSQARRLGINPGVLFHVAWAQVLAQTSGRDDVVFGSVLLGRLQGYAGADQVMGMFINTLPVRISLAGISVLEVIQATYQDLMALLEHEQAPLALAIRCSGVTPPMPLFSALLNYRHSHSGAADAKVWNGMRMLTAEERTNYPLTLSVDDLGEDFSLVTQSVSGIDPTRLANYLITAISGLVEALANDPQRLVLSLPILPAAERQQLLVDFNAPQTDFPQEALIHELFEQQAMLAPDAIAVVCAGQSLSYGELNRRANRLAHHLLTLGVQPDDRVAICVERSLEMVVGLLGILKAGAAYLPLDPAYPAERLAYMLSDAAPVALLTQSVLAETLDSHLPTVVLDARSPSALDGAPDSNPDSRARGVTSRHLAYVIYTSGSTGQPKGVMVEHANILRLLAATQDYFRFSHHDVWTLFHSFAFDFSVWELWGALAYGGRLVIVPAACARSPQAFYALLCDERVTVLNQTPSAFRQLIPAQDDTAHALRCIIFGGEALELPSLAPWIANNPISQTRLVNMYGITEITVHATYRELTGDDISGGRGSLVGQPLPDLHAYLLDPHGQPVPLGVTGELYIGGAGVARGYLNQPALTTARFIPDPFSTTPGSRLYKTGDLGRWLPDGNIEYLGRNDFQVKLRGFRIELGEIEARLAQCSEVRDAVVIAREDIPGDTRLVAYLLPQPGTELVPAALRQQLAQHLADYMLPSAFVMLEAFPLTPNGKLDRKALPAPEQSAIVVQGYVPPQGEVETMLAQIWQELLGLERVGRHDNFFESGGHSLLAVQLLNCISEQGMEVSLATLFSHPTLCDLALAINDKSNKPSSPFDANPVPLSPKGSLSPLFLVHETTGDPLVYSLLATLLPPERPVYGLQALGLHTLEKPPTSIEELAAYHVQAIRRVQPHGPYHLAGWSIGGVIVYEMALQLISHGEEVKYLGMIDSYNLSGLKIGTESGHNIDANKSVNDTQKDINTIIEYLRDHIDVIDKHDLDKLYDFNDMDKLLTFCEEHQWLPTGITKADILLRIYTQRAILQFGQKYIAPASSLSIHLYTADNLPAEYDSWRGWRNIVGENSVLHSIGGTHNSIMQQPLLGQLADLITEHLLPTTYTPNIVIQNGDKSIPPLFCIPGAGANASGFIGLALSLPPKLPVHALQSRGLIDAHLPPYISVESSAHAYIQAIRQTQPHGPYHLLGHSFGGWIAFEIALQLQAQGEQVTDLILVDTSAPDPQDSVPKAVGRIETLMKLIDIYNMMLTQPLPFTSQDFENQEPDEQIRTLFQALVNAGIFPGDANTSLLQGIVQVMQANLNTSYTPHTRYKGLVHLINAKEGDIDETEAHEKMGRRHVTQLSTITAPGNHMTMLSSPQVNQLATLLWEKLDYVSTNFGGWFMK